MRPGAEQGNSLQGGKCWPETTGLWEGLTWGGAPGQGGVDAKASRGAPGVGQCTGTGGEAMGMQGPGRNGGQEVGRGHRVEGALMLKALPPSSWSKGAPASSPPAAPSLISLPKMLRSPPLQKACPMVPAHADFPP